MVVGTTFGVYRCIDLRFVVVFLGWNQPISSPIVTLTGLSGCHNLILSGCADGRLYLWDIDDDDIAAQESIDNSNTAIPACLAVFERIINKDSSSSRDHKDIDQETMHLLSKLDLQTVNVHTFPDCPYILSSNLDGTITLWNLQDTPTQSMALQVQTSATMQYHRKRFKFCRETGGEKGLAAVSSELAPPSSDPEILSKFKNTVATTFYQQYEMDEPLSDNLTMTGDPVLATSLVYHFPPALSGSSYNHLVPVPVFCSVILDGTQITVSR